MKPALRREQRICFLLGKPVRPATVFPELFDLLRATPATVTMHVPRVGDPLPADIFAADLVVQRGLSRDVLACARRVEMAGTRCCNRIVATIEVADRALTAQRLLNHGLPIPRTMCIDTWPKVVDLAHGQPVVVKAADGSIGRGIGVFIAATGRLPPWPPFAGPYIVQDFVHGGGQNYKVYVAGCQMQGLVKRWPLRQVSDTLGVPLAVDTELATMARLVGMALDLEIYGVDFLYGSRGPVIVDVNPFPGFRGVSQAARLITDHLTTIGTGHECDLHSR